MLPPSFLMQRRVFREHDPRTPGPGKRKRVDDDQEREGHGKRHQRPKLYLHIDFNAWRFCTCTPV